MVRSASIRGVWRAGDGGAKLGAMLRRSLLGLAGLLLANPVLAQTQPQPRLPEEKLVIVTRDGKRHEFRVEMALTMEQQMVGLMFRPSVGTDEGMLFDWGQPRESSMWMRNTIVPLDMPGSSRVGYPYSYNPDRARQRAPGGDRRDQVGVAGGVDADPVGAEQGRAAAQVGPALLLHVGDHDEVPLEPLGPVGREQADRRAPHALLGQGVGGQLLGDDAGEERGDADVVALVDRA